MNKYELGVIIRADLDDEVYQSELERVKALVDRFGGSIDKIDDWGRRRLAYPIEKLTEGMYTFISYSSESSTPKDVENRLRLMENVLRFLTIRKDEEPQASPDAEPAEEETSDQEEATITDESSPSEEKAIVTEVSADE